MFIQSRAHSKTDPVLVRFTNELGWSLLNKSYLSGEDLKIFVEDQTQWNSDANILFVEIITNKQFCSKIIKRNDDVAT
jgi:hypothetical protein